MSSNTTSSATGEEKTSAAVDDVESSSITPLSHQTSDSSSQPSSSQGMIILNYTSTGKTKAIYFGHFLFGTLKFRGLSCYVTA